MKNIIGEHPDAPLHGRLKASSVLLQDSDVLGKEVLDIGCGFGWCILHMLKRGASHVTGIEYTKEAMQTAISAVGSFDNVSLAVAPATRLPFPDESFDTVVCWEVLEHIPSHTEHLLYAETYRVLRPGGTFYLSTPLNTIASCLADPAFLAGHRHYSPSDLRILGDQSGFTIHRIVTGGKIWRLLFGLNMYLAKWVFRRRPFWEHRMNERMDREYDGTGYMDVFAIYNKHSV